MVSYLNVEFFFCSNNVELYKVLLKDLAVMIDMQFTGNAKSRASSMVINTTGWIKGICYDVFGLCI